MAFGRTGTLRRGAGLESPFDTVLFLRRFRSGAESASTSIDDLRLGGAVGALGGTPPLVMNAIPRRWSGSAESNLAGKKTIGRFVFGMGRWNAWASSVCDTQMD